MVADATSGHDVRHTLLIFTIYDRDILWLISHFLDPIAPGQSYDLGPALCIPELHVNHRLFLSCNPCYANGLMLQSCHVLFNQ
jgi:hypothetical protein